MMTATQEFQAPFLSHATQILKEDPIAIVDQYLKTRNKTIIQATKMGIGENGMKEIRSKAANAFFRRWMMLKYPSIDLSFTNRKWWLKIERDDPNADPRIVEAYDADPGDNDLDASYAIIGCVNRYFTKSEDLGNFTSDERDNDREAVSQRAGSFASRRAKGRFFRATDVTVHANLPDGICHKHVKIAREALAHFTMARAILFTRDIEFLSELDGEGSRWSWHRDSDAQVRIIWSPTLESLSVRENPIRVKIDPAIILDMHDNQFILDFYDTPDENSIERMIREFSEGRL